MSATRLSPLAAVPAVLALALFAAGCGGSSPRAGVANLTSNPATTTAPQPAAQGGQSTAARRQGMLALAACMHKHGVPNFPEPSSKGTLLLTPGSGIDPSSPSFQAGLRACQKLAPGGAPSQAASPQTALKFARCMRSHGLPNFPDPKSLGRGNFNVQIPNGIDPNSPQFEGAMKACQSLSPFPGGGA